MCRIPLLISDSCLGGMGRVDETIDDDVTIIRGQGVLRVGGDGGGDGLTRHIRQARGPLNPGEVTVRVTRQLKCGLGSVRFPEHPWDGAILVFAP